MPCREAVLFCPGKANPEKNAHNQCGINGENHIEKNRENTPLHTRRYIPSEIRERVFERADWRCEYRSPAGVRCSCRAGLQIEHTLPFAVYQTNDERYLRAFCPNHNRFAAEKFYGREFIEEKVRDRRRKAAAGV
jgi:hypothetical protein